MAPTPLLVSASLTCTAAQCRGARNALPHWLGVCWATKGPGGFCIIRRSPEMGLTIIFLHRVPHGDPQRSGYRIKTQALIGVCVLSAVWDIPGRGAWATLSCPPLALKVPRVPEGKLCESPPSKPPLAFSPTYWLGGDPKAKFFGKAPKRMGQGCIRREGEGGEGVWNPKFGVPKTAQTNISSCELHCFPR